MNLLLSITDKAREFINKFNEKNERYFRISVIGGGCQGFKYNLSYTNDINKEDTVYNINNLDVVIDFKSSIFLHGLTVDYSDGLNGTGFTFTLPEAKSCGCGTSFSL